MATPRPALSLVVPTRRRPEPLRRLLDSLAATAESLGTIEIVLVVDADDQDSIDVRHELLSLKHVVVPPGQTMGALNESGAAAATGDFLMLLNDDVVARTPGWDEKILRRCRRFADGIVLVHVNDTLLQKNLCTFPIVSRAFCKLAGGICPREYIRYRIDDHIEDVFNLLAMLGERRTIYLPDVIFEHLNFIDLPDGPREYHSDPEILARDAPLFLDLFAERKKLAIRLLRHIGASDAEVLIARRRLERIDDPFSLRVPSRLRVESDVPAAVRFARFFRRQAGLVPAAWKRGKACWRDKGARGLAAAGWRRVGAMMGLTEPMSGPKAPSV
jgi:glycosyltransferase involved in cell wall biosynthesis